MHKFVLRLMILSFILSTTLLAHQVAFAGWSPWNYQSGPSKSVPGGTLKGNSATQWSDDSSLLWAVDANTYGPAKGWGIEASAYGYDRCQPSDPWTYRMSGDNTRNDTSTYTNAGRAQSYFFDCGQGGNHAYYVQHWNDWWTADQQVYDTNGTWIY